MIASKAIYIIEENNISLVWFWNGVEIKEDVQLIFHLLPSLITQKSMHTYACWLHVALAEMWGNE